MEEPLDSWHRMDNCCSDLIDQSPNPEVDLHYPTRQELNWVNVRNLNQAFPDVRMGPAPT